MTTISDAKIDVMKARPDLKLLGMSYLSVREWKELTSDWNIVIGKKISLSAAIFYLFEGAIPMVTSFCSEFYRMSGVGPNHKPFERDSTVLSSLWNFFLALQVKKRFD